MRRKGFIAVMLAVLLTFSGGIHTVSAEEAGGVTEMTTATALSEETTTTQPEETTTVQLEETTTTQPEETTTTQSEETTTTQPEETIPVVPTIKPVRPSVEEAIDAVSRFILKNDKNPDAESSWFVISVIRSGKKVPQKYKDAYYKNVLTYLEKNDWSITKSKYSEYSKLIIGLTAIGKDARDIAGHNMLSYLSDFTNVKRQGFNGTVWALLALNSHDSYEIPINPDAKEQVTEEGLISTILGAELAPGGWALYGAEPDADMTGMTIQALSSYYGKREDVTAAIDRAVHWLSTAQLPSGGYETIGTETAESAAQVITALSSVGVDCGKDARFVKSEKWPMTGLMQYYLSDGSFAHSADSGYNGLATAQGMYALVSYKRMQEGKSFIYHMTEIPIVAGEMLDDLALEDEKKENEEKKESSKKKKTAKTKTLGKIQLNGSKNANKNTSNNKTEQKNTIVENTVKENTGWSFEGAEYVPETIGADTTGQKGQETQRTGIAAYFPEDMTAEGYIAVGAGGVLLAEAFCLILYKLLKKKKTTVTGNEKV